MRPLGCSHLQPPPGAPPWKLPQLEVMAAVIIFAATLMILGRYCLPSHCASPLVDRPRHKSILSVELLVVSASFPILLLSPLLSSPGLSSLALQVGSHQVPK